MHKNPASVYRTIPLNQFRRHLTARLPRFVVTFMTVLATGFLVSPPLQGLTSVKLSWNANPESNISGYKVLLGPSSGNYTISKDVGKTTSTTVSGLTPSTIYFCALQAFNTGGLGSDYSSEISFTTPAGAPKITVSGSNGIPMIHGSSVVPFGNVGVGSVDATRTVIVANAGNADLTGLSVLLGGLMPSDFSVSTPGSGSLAPGQEMPITITCEPGNVGARSAVLQIVSNDTDRSPFEITLTGTGSTPSELIGSWALSSGLSGANAGSKATPANDGVPNLLKYAFNMNAAAPDLRVLQKSTGTAGLPSFTLDRSGAQAYFTVEYLRRKGSGLVYTPKTSTSLSDFTPMAGVPVVTAIDDDWERVKVQTAIDPVSTTHLFGRVDVEVPDSGVMPESTIFNQWAATGGLAGANSGTKATPYSDGVPNLVKYAFNMNAAGPDLRMMVRETGTAGLPNFAVDRSGAQSYFTVEFLRRKNSGLVYIPKISSDMKTFSQMTGATTITSIDSTWERVRVQKTIDMAISPTLFGIVELTMP